MGERKQISISSEFKHHEEVEAAALREGRNKTNFATVLFDWAFEIYRQKCAILGRPALVDMTTVKLAEFAAEPSAPGRWPSGKEKAFVPAKIHARALAKKERDSVARIESRGGKKRKPGGDSAKTA